MYKRVVKVIAYGAAVQAGMLTEKPSYSGGTSAAVKVMKSEIAFIPFAQGEEEEVEAEVYTNYLN